MMSSSHPDVNSERVGYCYNLEQEMACTNDASALLDSLHGMGSYGIISARPDNDRGITGIAPNVTHMAIGFGSIIGNTDEYARTLRMVGGLEELPADGRPGAEVPVPGADIISCSHDLEGDPVPEEVSFTLDRLACEGRHGLGTILVYSAGNRDCYIGDENEFATNPNTIGVANTRVRDDGMEVRWQRPADGISQRGGSNYSPWIDMCANGESALSLQGDPNASGPVCEGSESDTGVFTHGGTSAAASMVGGAAALVLTINPNLNWMQVRSILCASAAKIDCGNTDPNGRWRASGIPGPVPTSCSCAVLPLSSSCAGASTPASASCNELPRGLEHFSDWYGYGRLDVYEAVKLAHSTIPEPPPACTLLEPTR
jgi:thermitase